jgi:hypothetical protein
MATKTKAPAFQSAAEVKKWNSLEHSAGDSLAKVAQGKATTADVQKISSTLGSMNKLAKGVFDDAVETATQLVEKTQDSNKLKLKEGLTAFETALNEALLKLQPDLVEQIQDIVMLESYEQTEELDKKFSPRFDMLQEMMPAQDLPTVNDLLAAVELIDESIDKKLSKLGAHLSNLVASTQRNALATTDKFQKGMRHVMNRHELRAGQGSILDALTPLAGNTNAEPGAAVFRSMTTALSNPKAPAIEGVTQAKPTSDIAEAIKSQTAFFQTFKDFLAKFGGGNSGSSGAGDNDEEDDEKEQKKADTWWRSFKTWIGDKYEKGKKKYQDNEGWIKALGLTLLTMATNPQFYATLGKMIQDYLTWDNIKSAAVATWDFIKDSGKGILDWVMDQLGLTHKTKHLDPNAKVDNFKDGGKALNLAGNAAKANDNLTPDQKAQMDAMDASFKDKNPNATLPVNPAAKDNKASWQSKVSNISLGGHRLGDLYGYFNKQEFGDSGDSSTTVNNRSTVGGSSTGPSSTTNNNQSSVFSSTGINISPGVTTNPAGTTPTATGVSTGIDNRPVKGTPQVGIDSYKFTSSIDDSLPLMNSTMFAH